MNKQVQERSSFKVLLEDLSQMQLSKSPSAAFSSEIAKSLDYLGSAAAQESLRSDPYWPKWNSPWWHMTLLVQMGLAHEIPARARETFKTVARDHYLQVFPLKEEEIPIGCDTTRNIYCHCALGTAVQILEACGERGDVVLPWLRGWFAHYQIADGGYNCDESTYLKETPRSSIVSTVPMLEALLCLSNRGLTEAEGASLDRGVQYLLERRLFRSISKKDAVIDPDFLQLTFPRFYEYDVLRGLILVSDWALKRQKRLSVAAIDEAFRLVAKKLIDGHLIVERQFYAGKRTLAQGDDGQWSRGYDVSLFPLLEAVGALGSPSPFLTDSFVKVVQNLRQLQESVGFED